MQTDMMPCKIHNGSSMALGKMLMIMLTLFGVAPWVFSSTADAFINQQDTAIHHTRGRMTKSDPSESGSPFMYLDSESIHFRVQELATMYPQFATLVTSQQAYGLPSAGTSEDCPYQEEGLLESGEGCVNWVLTIEDSISHEGSTDKEGKPHSWKELPEVLLSGCLHGNERIGPTTVTETATLLLEAAACEASLHPASLLYTDPNSNGNPAMENCAETLNKKWGVTDTTRRWLSRLVSTRRIVIVPTANALGYYRNKREEEDIDPNRDFPYDLEDYSQCMQTVAVRLRLTVVCVDGCRCRCRFRSCSSNFNMYELLCLTCNFVLFFPLHAFFLVLVHHSRPCSQLRHSDFLGKNFE
jgi:hypothetical protein